MVKVGEAKKSKTTKIGRRVINFAEIGEYAICIIGLGGWTLLYTLFHTVTLPCPMRERNICSSPDW